MTKAIVRKWGNSYGVIIPKEIMERQKIKENDEIEVFLVKEADISHTYGTLPRKMSGQKFKDMVRKGWD